MRVHGAPPCERERAHLPEQRCIARRASSAFCASREEINRVHAVLRNVTSPHPSIRLPFVFFFSRLDPRCTSYQHQIAEECVSECSVMWDDVEELSAANSKKKPADEIENNAAAPKISEADFKFIKETQKTLAKAKSGATVDMATLRQIEAAAATMSKVKDKKVIARIAMLEKSLQEAMTAAKACTDNCAVEWETVEEISEAKFKAGQ